MYLTIDFYEPEWHNHRIVCQCYVKHDACRDAKYDATNMTEYDACRDAKSCVSTAHVSTECMSAKCDAPGAHYIETHIALTELERYIADVYHYTGQYYDSSLEEYFDKENWDSVLHDLEYILNRREEVKQSPRFATCADTQDFASLRKDISKSEPLPDMPVIIKELIMVA